MERGLFTSKSSIIHFQKWESLLRWKKDCGFFFTIFINVINLPKQSFSVKIFGSKSKIANFRCPTATFVNRRTRKVNLRCHFLSLYSVNEDYT